MEIQQQQLEAADVISPEGILPSVSVETENLPKLPPAKEAEAQWRRVVNQVSYFLERLPEYLSEFLQKNQRPLINIALILSTVIAVKIVLAVLDAINDIPLLSPTFELIGIGYFTWFSLRYLIKAETRQELTENIRSLKQQIMDDEAPRSNDIVSS
ncbi:MAG: CAAD domain-containing protein [Nodularia sp. CChRGM 3473]